MVVPLVALPALVLTALVVRFPLVGLWDGLVEGVLIGLGVVGTAHRLLADRSRAAVGAVSMIASLMVLEVSCRLFLPAPPAFPIESGPHLFLADALRVGSMNESWDARSKDFVCSVIHEDQYPVIFGPGQLDSQMTVPRQFSARADKQRRVLHVGDSITWGLGVARDQTFTAYLERLEPETQHINAGIPGTAPDAYLLVMRRWLALREVDAAVLYLFEGNDLFGLDDSYPCADWQSLLSYTDAGAELRDVTASRVDLGNAGFTWLRYNSPPPYLVRVLIPHSVAASHLAAAIVAANRRQPFAHNLPPQTALLHLGAILRAAREDAERHAIPLIAIVIPSRFWVEHPDKTHHYSPAMIEAAKAAGVLVYDAWDAISAAVGRGENVFLDVPGDPHFNAQGHELIARWLHNQLAAATRPSAP